MVVRRVALAALAALAGAGAGQAIAAPADDPSPPTTTPPPGTFQLPGMTLRIAPTQITVGTRGQVTFVVALTRKLEAGTLTLTLPQSWRERSADGRPQVKTPLDGSVSTDRVRVRRNGREVRFSFKQGRRGDVGRYHVIDRSLRPATYRPRAALRIDGREEASATASVVVLGLPVRVPEP
jgi:hypothetical protein